MADAMVDYLRQDMECEDLLECFHGLTGLDREVFAALTRSEAPLTVDEVAARAERERSTAYRAVQRLLGAGLVR